MELLLDNLKNTFFKGKPSEEKVSDMSDTRLLVQIIIVGGLSFLMGRLALYYSLTPCAIALMTVLMSRGKAHIYALPVALLGMLSAFRTGCDYQAEMIALVICTVIFFFSITKRITLFYRALITGGIMVTAKTAYFLWAGLFFLYNGFRVALELLILFTFISIFNSFFQTIDKGLTKEKNPLEVISVFSMVIMISVAGLGISAIGPISPLHLMALLLTILVGNYMGSTEGAVVGILTGIIGMLVVSDSPALAGILGFCGIISGFFKGQKRLLTGVCFAGLVLTFDILNGQTSLYFSVYEPILAAIIFILLPRSVMCHLNQWFSIIRQDDQYYEITARKRVKEQLKDYQEVFEKLSLCCRSSGNFSPAGDIVSQQFKGMSNALTMMINEMTWKQEPLVSKRPGYKMEIGIAGYAKEDKVSGDSYLCTGFEDNGYLIVLSDGMGKGVRAAEESTLTVKMLHNLLKAGFEVELALRMINSILLLKSTDEIFSTLDMAYINLLTGKARFFKIGAAASYLKRGDEVKTIKVPALPMGIINRISVESLSFQLRRGDQIIIASDGIEDAEREENKSDWLKTAIEEIRSKDPQTMADLIINKAVQRYGLREKDDMTVIVAVVE